MATEHLQTLTKRLLAERLGAETEVLDANTFFQSITEQLARLETLFGETELSITEIHEVLFAAALNTRFANGESGPTTEQRTSTQAAGKIIGAHTAVFNWWVWIEKTRQNTYVLCYASRSENVADSVPPRE